MKSTVHPDGRVDLEGTPEELAAFSRARFPAYFVTTGPMCTCGAQVWGTAPQPIRKNPCALHGFSPAFPQITAAAGRPPTTMTRAHPAFESAELGYAPATRQEHAEQAEFEHSLKVLGMPRVGTGG